jgi:hypothetical protein
MKMLVKGEHELHRYDPFRDAWEPSSKAHVFPDALRDQAFYWTGLELIAWDSHGQTGYLFYP